MRKTVKKIHPALYSIGSFIVDHKKGILFLYDIALLSKALYSATKNKRLSTCALSFGSFVIWHLLKNTEKSFLKRARTNFKKSFYNNCLEEFNTDWLLMYLFNLPNKLIYNAGTDTATTIKQHFALPWYLPLYEMFAYIWTLGDAKLKKAEREQAEREQEYGELYKTLGIPLEYKKVRT
jgi:hypothetical protein